MKPIAMVFALGLVGAVWAEEPQPGKFRLGIAYDPFATPTAESLILNPVPAPDVLQLPRFDVKEKPLKLDPEEILTEYGLTEAAKKRYLSPLYTKTFGPLAQLAEYYLNFFSLLGGWHPNDAEALVLYYQDKRLQRLRSFDDLISVTKVAAPDDAKELLILRNEAFRRDQTIGPDGAHPTFYLSRTSPRRR